MLNLAQNSPPRIKNTNTNHFSGEKQNKTYIYKQKHEQKQENRTPFNKKKLTLIVYYKYQQRSLQR